MKPGWLQRRWILAGRGLGAACGGKFVWTWWGSSFTVVGDRMEKVHLGTGPVCLRTCVLPECAGRCSGGSAGQDHLPVVLLLLP